MSPRDHSHGGDPTDPGSLPAVQLPEKPSEREKIRLDILRLLMDNTPQDPSDTGDISRKILFQSVNYKPRQIEKACNELQTRGLVQLHAGFYKNDWSSISITDQGIDTMEPDQDWD